MVKVLRYRSVGHWFDSRWCHWNFSLTSSRSYYGPGVDSASNRNEYQENFLGVNAAGAYGWQPYHLPVPLSWNLGTLTSWNPLGHSRPVTGLIYLLLVTHRHSNIKWNTVTVRWRLTQRKTQNAQSTQCCWVTDRKARHTARIKWT